MSSSRSIEVRPSAEEEKVARLRFDGERVDVDVGVGTEHSRDHRALRVVLRLFPGKPLRTSSATSEWSAVSCSRSPRHERIGARVADVGQ